MPLNSENVQGKQKAMSLKRRVVLQTTLDYCEQTWVELFWSKTNYSNEYPETAKT